MSVTSTAPPQIGGMMQEFGVEKTIADQSTNVAQTINDSIQTWECSCGQRGISGNFCSNCGARKPEVPSTWDCTCGNKGFTGKFCGECGKRRGE